MGGLTQICIALCVLLPFISAAPEAVLPVGPPLPAPDYMADNRGNYFGHAPDKGILNGPIISPESYAEFIHINATKQNITIEKRQSSSTYWMEDITHGSMPLAPSGYQFYRNVKDFGAKGDGVTDDTAAINLAASSGGRCGQACGATTTLGAIVYFPNGTYIVNTPIIQYYYTQFIGDANSRPVIKGGANFSGIALIDTDVYIPGGGGAEWYINQNQFYRSIRNFVIDLTAMPRQNQEGFQTFVPTGIHWQVAQSTSLQNIDFQMPVSDSSGSTTAVGIFMENGSGGYVEDLTFFGGNIGFNAGSQQFTARNLQFTSCLTAISHIWNWSFTWKNIYVYSCWVAINCTQVGGATSQGPPQGTGSITVLDSYFNGVPYPIILNGSHTPFPNIVIDNLRIEGNTPSVVLISGGETILPGTSDGSPLYIRQWAMGKRYTTTDGVGAFVTGYVSPVPTKSPNLLDNTGKIFEQSKPLYASNAASDFVIATANGVKNDGTGDQHAAINTLLQNNVGKPIYFPAGIYAVGGTVNVPVNSILVGEAWSQIMATGSYFQNQASPQVMLQVGKPGDSGVIQMTDLLFTVQGGTAGAILVEWNVHESTQGSAAMWDCHFRVGGAAGSSLQLANCPKGSTNTACYAASMMMHVTPQASGYFANVWAWVADHDIDAGGCDGNTTTCSQISVFGGRGILIESQGPTWLYGTASEHSVLYQYQLLNASNIYMGLMQTETPYFQPDPNALSPYTIGEFPSDPTFDDCADAYCNEAWALRILNSTNILIYGAGFYSFFSDFSLTCNALESCQQRVVQTSFTEGLWMYNLATKGVVEMVSPAGGIPPTFAADDNQSGYTTEVSLWIELALTGADIGTLGNSNSTGSGVVYIDPSIWSSSSPVPQCYPPCTLIMPPQPLSTTTTITFPPWTTEVYYSTVTTRTTVLNNGNTTAILGYTVFTVATVITIPPVTTTEIPVWAITITSGETQGPIYMTSSVEPSPYPITITPTVGGTTSIKGGTATTSSGTTEIFYWGTYVFPPVTETVGGSTTVPGGTTLAPVTTTITPHPYPTTTNTKTPDPALNTRPTTYKPGPPKPTCTSHCGKPCFLFCISLCPFCPPGIGPPGGINGGTGPGGNGNPNSQSSSSECSTTTASSCTSLCTVSATPSCTQTCSNVIECEATGTSGGSTVTIATGLAYTTCPWTLLADNAAKLTSAGSAMDSYLSSLFSSDTGVRTTIPSFTPTSGGQGSEFSPTGTGTGGGGGGGTTTTNPPTTSSTKPTSTTASATPTPSNQISIFYDSGCDDTTCYASWYVYATTVGGSVDVCNYYFTGPDPLFDDDNAPQPDSNGDLPYASSLGPFTDGNYKNCVYTGSSTGGGSLTCTGFAKAVPCYNFSDSSCTVCANGEGADEYCAETYCQW